MQNLTPLLIAIFCLTTASEAVADKPNIILIISDDQAYADFGFMGNPLVRTPHLDRLAARSARFPNSYVPTSVCRPSLATLLTGLYPHQHGVHFNHPPPGFAALTNSPEIDKHRFDTLRRNATRFIRDVPTLPRLLAARGYRCFQTGKYWEGHWRNAGFTEGMTTARPSGGKYGDKRLASGDLVAHGNGDHGLAIGRETMQPIYDFINGWGDGCGETPFFLWYAPFLPHTPHDAPRRCYERYDGSSVPHHRLPYYASISQFDDTVGALVQYLEERNLAKNALFLFVIDNGWEPDPDRFVENRREWNHTKRSKRSPFEPGLRTPILIRWDGRIPPATHPGLVGSIDIVPTLLTAAGIETAQLDLPGRNLLPVAQGKQTIPPDRPLLGEIYPGDATTLGNPSADVAYRWVRRGNYKLILPHAHNGNAPWNRYLDAPALFDLRTDPRETQNLFDDPRHKKTAAELQQLLGAWWQPDEAHTPSSRGNLIPQAPGGLSR